MIALSMLSYVASKPLLSISEPSVCPGCRGVECDAAAVSVNGNSHADDVVRVNSVRRSKGVAEQQQVAAFAVSANESMQDEFPLAVGQEDGVGADGVVAEGANEDGFAIANDRVHAASTRVEADRRILMQQRDGDLAVRLWMGVVTHRREF